MRWRESRALVGLVLMASVALAPPVAAQSPDDVLLRDIGPDWHADGCTTPVPAGSAGACFVKTATGDHLQIEATPLDTRTDPRTLVDQLAAPYTGTPSLATDGLDAATGFVLSAGSTKALVIIVAGSQHVFKLDLITSGAPAAATDLLVATGRRQQERDGGPPPSPAPVDPQEALELERLLVTLPPDTGLVEASTTTQRENYDDLRSQARSQRVIDLLNDHLVATRLFQSSGGALVVVTVSKHAYQEFAAIELGATENLTGARNVRPLTGVDDGVTFESGAEMAAMFRRGPYFVMVFAAAPETISASVLTAVVADIASRQAALLPSGPTGPYSFPSLAQSLTLALVLTTLACLAAATISRLRARRRRHAIERHVVATAVVTTPGDAIDVSRRAALLRRRGYVLLVAEVVAVDALVVGVLIVLGVIDLPKSAGVTVAVIGLAGGLAITAVAGRRELAAFGGSGGPRCGRWQSPIGLGATVVAVALLVTGFTLAASGLADFVFGPSIGGLERAAALHVAPGRLSTITLLAGLVLLVGGGIAVRLARMWSGATAKRLRQLDTRPPILYLRSFDDDALPLPTVLSARRPFLELFVPRGADPFEEALAWELAPYGPVVAIGRPGRSLASLGAARDHLADDEWRGGVTERMAAAQAIVMAIGSTPGVHWEIGALVGGGHLAKTIFLFPPTGTSTQRERWRFTAAALSDSGVLVPPLPGDADLALAAMLDRRGQWHAAAAARRDEASYRVAIDVMMSMLDRNGEAPVGVTP